MLRFKLKERVADKEFREKRRVTMLEIAADTGIGRITLSRMVHHSAATRADTLSRLCAYFQCNIEDLVEYVPDEDEKLTGAPQRVSRGKHQQLPKRARPIRR